MQDNILKVEVHSFPAQHKVKITLNADQIRKRETVNRHIVMIALIILTKNQKRGALGSTTVVKTLSMKSWMELHIFLFHLLRERKLAAPPSYISMTS